jgi:hypothetical protein
VLDQAPKLNESISIQAVFVGWLAVRAVFAVAYAEPPLGLRFTERSFSFLPALAGAVFLGAM